VKVLALVAGCETCPNKHYHSGGRSECSAAGSILPPLSELRGGPAEWCPLAEYPSRAIETMREEIASLRRRPTTPEASHDR
jgi:hypothetical protein